MRYTVNSGGKWLVPKDQWGPAGEKLARYENVEEIEDVKEYCKQILMSADELEKKQLYGYAEMMRHNAALIAKLNSFQEGMAGSLMNNYVQKKAKFLEFLDDVDGQILDDPVFVIREKAEEIL